MTSDEDALRNSHVYQSLPHIRNGLMFVAAFAIVVGIPIGVGSAVFLLLGSGVETTGSQDLNQARAMGALFIGACAGFATFVVMGVFLDDD